MGVARGELMLGDGERGKLLSLAARRNWRAFGLQPHRLETFKLSTDPDFVAKVRDVVGLYVSPPDRAVVLCVCCVTEIDGTHG